MFTSGSNLCLFGLVLVFFCFILVLFGVFLFLFHFGFVCTFLFDKETSPGRFLSAHIITCSRCRLAITDARRSQKRNADLGNVREAIAR